MIVKALWPAGWSTYAIGAVETLSKINEILDQLQNLAFYSNRPLGSNGLVMYTYLEQNNNYDMAFWVWSHNLAATSFGLVTSVIDVTAIGRSGV